MTSYCTPTGLAKGLAALSVAEGVEQWDSRTCLA